KAVETTADRVIVIDYLKHHYDTKGATSGAKKGQAGLSQKRFFGKTDAPVDGTAKRAYDYPGTGPSSIIPNLSSGSGTVSEVDEKGKHADSTQEQHVTSTATNGDGVPGGNKIVLTLGTSDAKQTATGQTQTVRFSGVGGGDVPAPRFTTSQNRSSAAPRATLTAQRAPSEIQQRVEFSPGLRERLQSLLRPIVQGRSGEIKPVLDTENTKLIQNFLKLLRQEMSLKLSDNKIKGLGKVLGSRVLRALDRELSAEEERQQLMVEQGIDSILEELSTGIHILLPKRHSSVSPSKPPAGGEPVASDAAVTPPDETVRPRARSLADLYYQTQINEDVDTTGVPAEKVGLRGRNTLKSSMYAFLLSEINAVRDVIDNSVSNAEQRQRALNLFSELENHVQHASSAEVFSTSGAAATADATAQNSDHTRLTMRPTIVEFERQRLEALAQERGGGREKNTPVGEQEPQQQKEADHSKVQDIEVEKSKLTMEVSFLRTELDLAIARLREVETQHVELRAQEERKRLKMQEMTKNARQLVHRHTVTLKLLDRGVFGEQAGGLDLRRCFELRALSPYEVFRGIALAMESVVMGLLLSAGARVGLMRTMSQYTDPVAARLHFLNKILHDQKPTLGATLKINLLKKLQGLFLGNHGDKFFGEENNFLKFEKNGEGGDDVMDTDSRICELLQQELLGNSFEILAVEALATSPALQRAHARMRSLCYEEPFATDDSGAGGKESVRRRHETPARLLLWGDGTVLEMTSAWTHTIESG
ncbi:unnamed protein product, partial [Amoebophrya sp. A25]